MRPTIDSQSFDEWAVLKKKIHFKKVGPYFKEREIWWASIGQNIGDEQNGRNSLFERPILIIRQFNKNLFLAIPLTGKLKSGKFYFTVKSGDRMASVVLSQIRLLDSKRLLRKMSVVDQNSFDKIVDLMIRTAIK